jgi:hypothetical protein
MAINIYGITEFLMLSFIVLGCGIRMQPQIKENNNPGLDPWFITGITDAEGCFLISVLKDRP